ncbi:MAG: PDZ domain-containing protein [Bacteroidales bacterium]|nr:PDZ domain-containing protein [Bacteroidales bacterium]
MKKIFLIILAVILNVTLCLSQEGNTENGYVGLQTKISANKKYLRVEYCWQGSPADIAGLKIGDRIYRIDDKNVSDMDNPVSRIRGAAGTKVKLTIDRFGRTSFFDVVVPRISIPFNDKNYASEGNLMGMILTNEYAEYTTMQKSAMALLHDDTRDMHKYKTYDFELTSSEDPLLEKKLLKELGEQLDNKGMRRSQENPDLIVLIRFFSGQKEQYVPPQQIVSTRVKSVYNWYWGVVPMPITESTTKEGYTDVTYLTSISLKFLDASEIATSKTPPVIWSGSISQTSKTKQILLDNCGDYFAILLFQFPEVWHQNSEYYFFKYYSYTGIWYNKSDLKNVSEVIPDSPADKAGVKKGDKIININGIGLFNKYSDVGANKWGEMIVRGGGRSGLRYLYMHTGLVFKPYKKETDVLKFKIKRNGEKMTLDVKPEKKFVFLMF